MENNYKIIKFTHLSKIGLKKIGKIGIILYIKNKNEFNTIKNIVKNNLFDERTDTFTLKVFKIYYYYIFENENKILICRFAFKKLQNILLGIGINISEQFTFINELEYQDYPPYEINIKNMPWENKKQIIQYIINRFENNLKSGLILDLPTGAGKTSIITYLAKYYLEKGKKVHIVIGQNSVLEQTLDEIQEKDKVRIMSSSKKAREIKKFDVEEDKNNYYLLISNIKSVITLIKNINESNPKKIYDFFDQFYLTLIDECHSMATELSLNAIRYIQTPCMLGLSATAGNHIGLQENIGKIYKPNFEELKFIININKINYIGPEEFTINQTRYFKELGKELNDALKTNLLIEKDHYRNTMIVNKIYELLKTKTYIDKEIFEQIQNEDNKNIEYKLDESKGHDCILVLTKNIDHIDDIINLILSHNESDIAIKPIKWDGKRKEEDVILAKNESNIIVATFDSFGVGTNIPKITAIIYATSYKDFHKNIQFFGRAIRPNEKYNNTVREIYDICDVNTFLKKHINTRNKVYKNKSKSHVIRKTTKSINYKDVKCNYNSEIKEDRFIEDINEMINKKKIDFQNSKNIIRNMENNNIANEDTVECSLCDKKFKTIRAFKMHVTKEHKDEYDKIVDDNEKEFMCNNCNKKFKTKITLNTHSKKCENKGENIIISESKKCENKQENIIQSENKNEEEFICKCGKVCANKRGLSLHQKKCNEEESKKEGPKKEESKKEESKKEEPKKEESKKEEFICGCGKVCANKRGLSLHQKKCNEEEATKKDDIKGDDIKKDDIKKDDTKKDDTKKDDTKKDDTKKDDTKKDDIKKEEIKKEEINISVGNVCKKCERSFDTERGLKIHLSRCK